MERLIIEEDTVYEIDEDCLCWKEEHQYADENKSGDTALLKKMQGKIGLTLEAPEDCMEK